MQRARTNGRTNERVARARLLLLATLGLLLLWIALASPVAHAAGCVASKEYTGPENASWTEANNWSGKALPTSTEVVCIPAGKGTITVPAKMSAQAKRLEADSTIKVEHEATLTIAENLEGTANDSTFSGLDVQGTLANAGSWFYFTGKNVIDGEITTPKFATAFIELLSGTLSGDGKVGVLFANAGTIEPGGAGAVGELHFINFSMRKTGTLILDLESNSKYDQLGGFTAGSGSYFLIGTIEVNLLGGYKPAPNIRWEFIHEISATMIFPEETTFVPANFTAEQEPFEFFLEQLPLPPVVVTEAATALGATTATLNGMVTPNGFPAFNCEFEYGTTISYEHAVSCSALGTSGYSPASTDALVSSLSPGTTYHFRVWAQTEQGRANGSDRTFTTSPASKEPPAGKEGTGGGGTSGTGGGSGYGGTTTTVTTSSVGTSGSTTPAATEALLLGCSKSQLVLNDAYIHGGRVLLMGSAAKSFAGKKVTILFNEKKAVATAIVAGNGQFSTTAPLPPAKIREALTTRYSAEIGDLRSLHLKLTRRLLLEPPKASGNTVTLTGKISKPLTKPITPVIVEQQLECGKTTIAKRFTPSASGSFHVTLTVPTGTKAAIYTLKSKVAANAHALKKGFTTYSLPLPVSIG